jgi:hypothetical protein
MSETATTDEPQAWFLAESDEDESGYSALARIRPGLIAERWHADTGDWASTGTNLWETLQEDPGWVEVDQPTAEAWMAARSGGAAPDSQGQSVEG